MSYFTRRQAVVFQGQLKDGASSALGSYSARTYQPQSLQRAVSETRFTRNEVRVLYRAFKETCCNSAVHRDRFRALFASLFPHGDTEHYADLVFATFTLDSTGAVSFHQFAKLLSTLWRGTLAEKLEWLYTLYDPKQSGKIEWHRILYIVTAVHDLIGTKARPITTTQQRTEQANRIIHKFDVSNKGWISKQDFVQGCTQDEHIVHSIAALCAVFRV